MNKLDSILKQNSEIKDFKVYDTQAEWDLFMEKVEGAPTVIHQEVETRKVAKTFSFYTLIQSIAALFVLVLFCLWTLKKPEKLRESFTATEPKTLELLDGTKIILENGAKIDYPITFEGQNTRNVDLDGNASFDVKKSIMPFNVYIGTLKVEVIGTKFLISAAKDTIFIENQEGVVKIANSAKLDQAIVLHKGDKFQYLNGQFKYLNIKDTLFQAKVMVNKKQDIASPKPTVEKKEAGSTYKLGSVIKNYILKHNKKLVKIDKKFKYDPEMRVKLNINLPYQDILAKLKSKGIIDTKPGDCEGCIIIIAPKDKGK